MSAPSEQSPRLQLVGKPSQNSPDAAPAELEAAHLSLLMLELIAERFEILRSSRAVANELRKKYKMHGVSTRTVTDAVMLATRRKPPAMQQRTVAQMRLTGGMR